jgi:2-polyprenyl-3-methyl-5-hydroxy-6-metoxy-1,4-benzoquinol methylase
VSAADPPAAIAASWDANAAAWTGAVRAGAIASRRLATDAAITAAVLARRPRRVLDLGCGEGWLARRLATERVEVVGVDGSAALVEAAAAAGGGATFLRLAYEDLIADPGAAGTGFDVVAANFALLAEDLVPLLSALRRPGDGPLAAGGALVVQTLHPLAAGPPYRDGWRTEDFRGLDGGEGRWRPMPWYFRTLSSWVALLREAGYALDDLREPAHPGTGDPLSLLATAT